MPRVYKVYSSVQGVLVLTLTHSRTHALAGATSGLAGSLRGECPTQAPRYLSLTLCFYGNSLLRFGYNQTHKYALRDNCL